MVQELEIKLFVPRKVGESINTKSGSQVYILNVEISMKHVPEPVSNLYTRDIQALTKPGTIWLPLRIRSIFLFFSMFLHSGRDTLK